MKKIALLRNTVQEYAWGSKTAIPELLGRPTPASKPQAELWMGAHPKGPSLVLCDGMWRSLLELIQESPEEVLGRRTVAKFSHSLPFLFKVIAPAKPLSIQAHPTREQARRGFAREDELGIPLDAPHRNYRDENRKSELICALTPFWALNGFRRVKDILGILEKLEVSSLANEIASLTDQPDQEGLKRFFHEVMTMESERRRLVVKQAVCSAEKCAPAGPVWSWLLRLHKEHPGDIGVLSPVFLNLVQLQPGEAIYIPPGELHAYLTGTGMELMSNSDNVLRGGLTRKHVDVKELMAVLTFTEKEVKLLRKEKLTPAETVYHAPTAEFILSVLCVREACPFTSSRDRSVEIMICTGGEARVTDLSDGQTTRLTKGTSIIVPAALEQYRIEGNATIYKAAVPD
ncbi:MAG: mannose-6-phosphate isomerase, class I [Syntrophobacteria bacterium]